MTLPTAGARDQLDAATLRQVFTHTSWAPDRVRFVRASRVPRRQRAQPVHHDRAVPALPRLRGGAPGAAAGLHRQPRHVRPGGHQARPRQAAARSTPARADAGDAAQLQINQNVLADLTESLIGAVYRDLRLRGGAARGRRGVRRAHPVRREQLHRPQDRAAGVPGTHGPAVVYRVLGFSGPPHNREFEIEAVVDGEALGHGFGTEQEARRAGGRGRGAARAAGARPAQPRRARLRGRRRGRERR